MAADIKTWGETQLTALRREMDALFDGLCADLGLPPLPGAGGVRILDRGASLLVAARLPGYAASEIEIAATERSLTIRGQGLSGAGARAFVREVRLPAEIDPAAATAVFLDDVLTVTLPRRRPTRPGAPRDNA